MMMMMIVSLRFFMHMARARFLLVVLKVTDYGKKKKKGMNWLIPGNDYMMDLQ